MNAEIQEIKARIAAHKATRPDVLKALHPDAPESVRSAYRVWSRGHEILKEELARAEWAKRQSWRNADGEIVAPLGWDSMGELLAPDRAGVCHARIDSNKLRMLGILEQLAQLHGALADMNELNRDSADWLTARSRAIKIRICLARAIRQEELRLEIPDIPLPPKHHKKVRV